MVKLHWRKGLVFLITLACATGVLVAAGLSEQTAAQPRGATGASQAGTPLVG